jgi:hypothetical protein
MFLAEEQELRTDSEAKAGDPKIEAEGYCRIRYSLKRPPHIWLDGRVLRLSLLSASSTFSALTMKIKGRS